MKKKIILALSWRDIKAPKSGGAEVLSQGIFSQLVHDGFTVVHISPEFAGCSRDETIDGVRYIRKGNSISVLWHAFVYYVRNHRRIWRVIDQCNTHRFFTPFYVPARKRILFIHQLTREIWDINANPPLSTIGKALETPWLQIYRKGRAITVSDSTRQDLVDIGFAPDRICIMPNWISSDVLRLRSLDIPKEKAPTFVYVGRYVAYKGIDICIEAFAKVKKEIPDAKLWIVGKKDQEYIDTVLEPLCKKEKISLCTSEEVFSADSCLLERTANMKSGDEKEENRESISAYSTNDADVVLWGFVSEEKKYELMKRATLLLFPSIREGWGIIVTEAALLGTPSLVCDAPGMRDAVDKGRAGYMCAERTPDAFAAQMMRIAWDHAGYEDMVQSAYAFSSDFVSGSDYIKERFRELEEFIMG